MAYKRKLKPAKTTKAQEKKAVKPKPKKEAREEAKKLYADEFGPKLTREEAHQLKKYCRKLEEHLISLQQELDYITRKNSGEF